MHPRAQAPVSQDRSTLPLSEVARHVVYPTGITGSLWYSLDDRFAEWGIGWDRWQDSLGELTLGTRADGKLACTVGGASWSIPRQVAKTFLGGRTVFGLATTFEDSTWLWTAHRTRTATQTFQKLAGFAQRKAVRRYLKPDRSDGIRSTNGEQEIRFRNGSRLMFGAREQGFGRGFDEVDGEVFDEAQILTEKALEDMIPATNQSRMPHGALLLFMGTPPRPVDPGEVFTQRREEALEGKPEGVLREHGDALYVECSADPQVGKPGGPSLDDVKQVAKANPSYPHRTPPEAIARMRKNLPSDESWRREALGVWDERKTTLGPLVSSWPTIAVPQDAVPQEGARGYGVAFSVDGMRLSLAGAIDTGNRVHVELIDTKQGPVEESLAPLADWFVEPVNGQPRWRRASAIALSGRAGAAVLAQLLVERRVPRRMIIVASSNQYFESCGLTLERVNASAAAVKAGGDPTFTHTSIDGQAALDESAATVLQKTRTREGAWGWVSPTGDETPIESVGMAIIASQKRVATGKAVFV